MISVTDAFKKFRSNLELHEKEQKDASRRQIEIREVMNGGFAIERDFLTGSYARWTKTKPLKDVDIFCVFADSERPVYRTGRKPNLVLDAVERLLVKKYGRSQVKPLRRSICVEFTDSQDPDRVMSFDVVPSFTLSDHYEIPDTSVTSGWTRTNPEIHAEKATAANEKYAKEWKGMVRMIKAWNREHEKPVKPAFLLEVMALEILRAPFNGQYPREFMSYFMSAAMRLDEPWPDPAGLGPPVNDSMDTTARQAGKKALNEAHYAIREALNMTQAGRHGEALQAYRTLFGPYFPLS